MLLVLEEIVLICIPNCCKVGSRGLEANVVNILDKLNVGVSVLYEVPVLMEAFNVELVGARVFI